MHTTAGSKILGCTSEREPILNAPRAKIESGAKTCTTSESAVKSVFKTTPERITVYFEPPAFEPRTQTRDEAKTAPKKAESGKTNTFP